MTARHKRFNWTGIDKDESGKDKILDEGGFARASFWLIYCSLLWYLPKDPDRNYIMVMDYMEGGNLRQFLQESKGLSGYREVIEDIKFHLEKKKESSKQSVQELTQKNQGKTGIRTGVPLLAEGELSLKLEAKVSHGRSHTQSKTETIEGMLEVNCPANSMVVAKAILQEHNLEIPITTTISCYLTDKSGNERKYTYKIDGTFKGKYTKAFVNYEKAVSLEQQGQVVQPTTFPFNPDK
ncbi:18289_t:CDS:2 [Entrophospora sp. SA101]|nr:448_t:CDS:2 [Entrophospora sp. SA101]CAJ0747155.1 18289_t:CDS:2 [Entrophospora sp. SA101]